MRIAAILMLTLSASLLAQAGSSAVPDTSKGWDLYRRCSNRRVKNATPAQIDEGNECVSYIEGFVDGKGPAYKFGCFIGFTEDQMVDAYLEYIEKNPEYLKMSKRLGLDAALTTKFCPYWKAPPK